MRWFALYRAQVLGPLARGGGIARRTGGGQPQVVQEAGAMFLLTKKAIDLYETRRQPRS